jgi:hypothetical protein
MDIGDTSTTATADDRISDASIEGECGLDLVDAAPPGDPGLR